MSHDPWTEASSPQQRTRRGIDLIDAAVVVLVAAGILPPADAVHVRADEVRLGDRLYVDGRDEGNVSHIERLTGPYGLKIVSHAQFEDPPITGGWHLRCSGERVWIVRSA